MFVSIIIVFQYLLFLFGKITVAICIEEVTFSLPADPPATARELTERPLTGE